MSGNDLTITNDVPATAGLKQVKASRLNFSPLHIIETLRYFVMILTKNSEILVYEIYKYKLILNMLIKITQLIGLSIVLVIFIRARLC